MSASVFFIFSVILLSSIMDANGTNLTTITWAHAVNNKSYLKEVLQGNIQRLEADVSIGKLNDIGEIIPIMAHPPANTSDLSLAQFLQDVKHYNDLHQQNPKGIKLDFKSLEAVNKSIDIINPFKNVTYPFWLNSDILEGPGNPGSIPVDPIGFLQLTEKFTNSVLSLGWTTGKNENSSYTEEHIEEMLKIIQNVQQEITFPVRAGILSRTSKHLLNSLKSVPKSTLTIWSSEGDAVDVKKLEEIIFDWGVDRIYIDVPKDLYDKLNLSTGSGSMSTSIGLLVLLVTFIFVINV